MPSSTRIKGNVLPVLKLGTPGTEYAADLISWTIENESADSDVVTFLDASDESTNRQFFLRGSAIQSTASASFWRYVWENTGTEAIPYTIAPHGNAVASAEQPHFVGTLKIGPKPTVGGEANASTTSAFTFEYEFQIDGEPTLDEGA